MHLILMTRGIKQSVDLWIKFMETQMFYWRRQPLLKDKDGNYIQKPDGTYERGPEEVSRVQGALRPIQLWEYVFPEQEMVGKNPDGSFKMQDTLPDVLAMLNSHTNSPLRPEVRSWAWILRKMSGAKPIPKMPDEIAKKPNWEITQRYLPGFDTGAGNYGVAVYPLGVRYDVTQDMIFPGKGAWYQEGL